MNKSENLCDKEHSESRIVHWDWGEWSKMGITKEKGELLVPRKISGKPIDLLILLLQGGGPKRALPPNFISMVSSLNLNISK